MELMAVEHKLAIWVLILFISTVLVFLCFVLTRFSSANVARNTFSLGLLLTHIINQLLLLVMEILNVTFDSSQWNYNKTLFWLKEISIALQLAVSLNVALITFDRFAAIKYHLRYEIVLRPWKQNLALLCIWLIASTSLSFHKVDYGGESLMHTILVVSVIFFVILIVVVVNIYLYYIVSWHMNRIHTDSIASDARQNPERKKAFLSGLFIVTSYVAVYLPIAVTELLNQSLIQIPLGIHLIISYLLTFHSLCDAIIYIGIRKHLRRVYNVLRERFAKTFRTFISTSEMQYVEPVTYYEQEQNTQGHLRPTMNKKHGI